MSGFILHTFPVPGGPYNKIEIGDDLTPRQKII